MSLPHPRLELDRQVYRGFRLRERLASLLERMYEAFRDVSTDTIFTQDHHVLVQPSSSPFA
jgi:hypothetical protein